LSERDRAVFFEWRAAICGSALAIIQAQQPVPAEDDDDDVILDEEDCRARLPWAGRVWRVWRCGHSAAAVWWNRLSAQA